MLPLYGNHLGGLARLEEAELGWLLSLFCSSDPRQRSTGKVAVNFAGRRDNSASSLLEWMGASLGIQLVADPKGNVGLAVSGSFSCFWSAYKIAISTGISWRDTVPGIQARIAFGAEPRTELHVQPQSLVG